MSARPDQETPERREDAPDGGDAPRRVGVEIEGTVQGVGFRPYVYRLATELGLAGIVRNDANGVEIEVEGPRVAVERFLERLPRETPPLASVDRLATRRLSPRGESTFRILASEAGRQASALVTPDTATCEDCLRELFDPEDRRFRYPFINCTNCGPRFTIVRGIPYDRPLTTMAKFEMCGPCRAEYEDPGDRRFHAQPNACPVCGPSVRLVDADGETMPTGAARDSVAAAAARLTAGEIVAVKGLGGYHLACTADHEEAVARLRRRKQREDKPFALMAPSLAAARGLVRLDPTALELLRSREAPIVLARREPGGDVAPSVAPGFRDLGVMLPYSPLHHLLLADVERPLVMTSGNVSDEPIAYRDAEARERLAGIAACFLVHDRPIETRTDDSVMRTVDSGKGEGTAAHASRGRIRLMLRRSRGYVPSPLPLPAEAPRPFLACGAHLKNTFCVGKGRRAWVSHHIGDLENYETYRSFEEGVEHFERLFEVEPEVVVHDLHPEYLATKYALEREGVERIGVQHHHAHLAACLAEHGESGPALGLVFDGTGFGPDGTVWGGELLVGDLAHFERVATLWPARLPGGEAAIRQPWRMACAWLAELDERPARPEALRDRVSPDAWSTVLSLVRKEVASPVTTSVGRLFDAVSAACGIRAEVSYEGQAAIELEMAAAAAERDCQGEGLEAYPLPLVDGDGPAPARLDARRLVEAAVADLEEGVGVPEVAARFHRGVADGAIRAAEELAGRYGLDAVVLSGGVFQNVLLLERAGRSLREAGLRVLAPTRLPPNDGGISYGQAAVAVAKLRSRG